MNSTEACIALNMLPTMGPVRLRKLLEVFVNRSEFLRRGVMNCAESKESATKSRNRFRIGRRLSIWPRS